MCNVCDIWTGFLFRITQRTFVILPPREVRVQWFSNEQTDLVACWKFKYLAPILGHSDSVALEWDLGISIFNKFQSGSNATGLGMTELGYLKRLSYFSLWEKYLMVISQTSLFERAGMILLPLKRGKLRKLESHCSVRIWKNENLCTQVSPWRVH